MATHDHSTHAQAHGHVHHDVGDDKPAAFIGLILGGIALFAIMFGVVKLTNAQFAGKHEGGAKAAAEATH